MSVGDLPEDGGSSVHWSSVNYKDGLASTPTGKVARISPMIPGIDLAGITVDDAPGIPAGTAVLAHGYDIGVSRHGGFSEYARVPAEWLVPLPDGLSARDAMVVGTAGFTAAMSVTALKSTASRPTRPVLVTGDRRRRVDGGAMLARSAEVVASTGKLASGSSCALAARSSMRRTRH
jgi:putative YhdH/YhfP family quinone oxidoreductase